MHVCMCVCTHIYTYGHMYTYMTHASRRHPRRVQHHYHYRYRYYCNHHWYYKLLSTTIAIVQLSRRPRTSIKIIQIYQNQPKSHVHA